MFILSTAYTSAILTNLASVVLIIDAMQLELHAIVTFIGPDDTDSVKGV